MLISHSTPYSQLDTTDTWYAGQQLSLIWKDLDSGEPKHPTLTKTFLGVGPEFYFDTHPGVQIYQLTVPIYFFAAFVLVSIVVSRLCARRPNGTEQDGDLKPDHAAS